MTDEAIQVLLVEDNAADAALLKRDLSGSRFGPFFVTHARRLTEAFSRLEERRFDAVLLDLGLPDSQGLETLERMHRRVRLMPVVVLTGLVDEAIAVRALTEGRKTIWSKGKPATT